MTLGKTRYVTDYAYTMVQKQNIRVDIKQISRMTLTQSEVHVLGNISCLLSINVGFMLAILYPGLTQSN